MVSGEQHRYPWACTKNSFSQSNMQLNSAICWTLPLPTHTDTYFTQCTYTTSILTFLYNLFIYTWICTAAIFYLLYSVYLHFCSIVLGWLLYGFLRDILYIVYCIYVYIYICIFIGTGSVMNYFSPSTVNFQISSHMKRIKSDFSVIHKISYRHLHNW